ncbi:Hpt domain-containing protein, partial [Acinetobacter baumannii]
EDDPAVAQATAPLAAGALIDRPFLDDQTDLLGAAQIAKLHHILEDTSRTLVDDIVRAANGTDHRQMARSAHRLGSAASALGLVGLFERCREVED